MFYMGSNREYISGGDNMNTEEQLFPMYKQQVFYGDKALILCDNNVIFDTVELYYLDDCGIEHFINENPVFTKNNNGYQISFKGQKRNLRYLIKYYYLVKSTSIELSKDEVTSYTNKDGSMTIPQRSFTSNGINFRSLCPKLYFKA